MNNSDIYSEDAVAFALYKQCIAKNSQVFFKFHHNLSFRVVDRDWYYYCAPEVDLIEVRNDGIIVAYELKGSRRHKSGVPDYPNVFDAIVLHNGHLVRVPAGADTDTLQQVLRAQQTTC